MNYSDFYNVRGDTFNIEAVCPDYLPDSQCWATWHRDRRGVAIVSGYDPEAERDALAQQLHKYREREADLCARINAMEARG